MAGKGKKAAKPKPKAIKLKPEEALKLELAAVRISLKQSRLETLRARAEVLRAQAEIGRLQREKEIVAIDYQAKELLRSIGEEKAKADALNAELEKQYGIQASQYTLHTGEATLLPKEEE